MIMIADNVSWQKFIWERATRIYPPYWLYTTLVLLAWIIVPSMVNSSFSDPPSIWKSYLLFPDKSGPLLAVGWTLIYEMYFYLCFAIILAASSRSKKPVIHIFLVLWAVFIIVMNLLRESYCIPTSLLTLDFIMGSFIALLIKRNFKKLGFFTLAIGIIGLIIALFAFANNMKWERTFLIGAPCALLVYGAVSIELNNKIMPPKWAVALGNASYSVYLSHILVLSGIGRLYALVPQNYWTEATFLIVSICVANAVGLCSYLYIEKQTLQFLRNSA